MKQRDGLWKEEAKEMEEISSKTLFAMNEKSDVVELAATSLGVTCARHMCMCVMRARHAPEHREACRNGRFEWRQI